MLNLSTITQTTSQGSRDYFNHPVEFRRVRLYRAILLSKQKPAEITVKISKHTGQFEILEGTTLCASGWISLTGDDASTTEIEARCHPTEDPEVVTLPAKDIYKEFRVRGYDYQSTFQGKFIIKNVQLAQCST